jgi:hypothetical protein
VGILDTGLRSLDGKVEELSKLQPIPLLTSDECFKDLNRELERLKDEDQVTVRLLALDLGRARSHLQHAVEHSPVNSRLRFEVLVISEALLQSEPPPPMRLMQWCKRANDTVTALTEGVRLLTRPDVELEMRRYSAWPFVHGVAIVRPVTVVYCSLCRWHRGQYDSGLQTYRKIKDPPLHSNQADDAAVFLSFFEQLWNMSQDSTVLLRPQVQPNQPRSGVA